jgi:lipopolysaccharide export system ATP-binding protein
MYRRARLGIGYLPQEASIFRGLTVEDNIRAVLEVVRADRERREAMLDALLAEFGHRASAQARRRWRCRAASGGAARSPARWRRSPASCCSTSRFAGIDPIAVGDIRDLVSHLKDRGIGVLITDHNVRETLEIIDRAYILHDGRC